VFGGGRSALGTVDLTKDGTRTGGGSPLGVLLGLGAVAAIGTGTAITAQRRRHSTVVSPIGLPIDPPVDPPDPPV
jgi:hypothetical protein